MGKKKDIIISLFAFAAIAGLIIMLCVTLIPILADIFTDQNGRDAISIIHSHGIRGIPVLASLQALQVITTVVPALLIQIPAGLVYGTWAGLAICLAGSILGNMIVFVALRQFSTTVDHIFPTRKKKREEKESKPKKKSKLPFFLNPESLNRMPHPELVAFYVYMIPGIPNGVLPHLFARTKVPFGRFLIAVAAGNAPSTLVCTLVGDRLAHGDWRSAIVIIAIFVACIGAALLLRRKLITLISGGYSLSLGSAIRKQPGNEADGESPQAPETAEGTKGNVGIKSTAKEKISDEPNKTGEVKKEEPTSKKNETPGNYANEENETLSNYANEENKTPSNYADEEMQASGTTDIAPHGWRIIKGKKQ
jgi:uncharacterized membrane protein YdjX (TVP38/TMEM64 family)